jgi:hypothetical protein
MEAPMEANNAASGIADVPGQVVRRRIRRRLTTFDFVRCAMFALWIFVMAVAVTVGDRGSNFGELDSALNTGDVTSMMVTPGLPSGVEGSQIQTIYWRSGLLNHYADVRMVTPDSNSSASSGDDIKVRSGYDIATQIANEHPAVTITRIAERHSYGQIYGFQVPAWLIWFALAGAVGTLMLLISGPEPRRATRWAWFWLITTVIGPPLFLILAGPTSPLRSPRETHRRLTGGWALLIALLFGSFMLSSLQR